MLGYAVDFDIACTGDGEAIGNASLELSHMGYDFTLLFSASMHTVAIWTFTFHKISGFVRVILKANFKSAYMPNLSIFLI